MAKYKIKGKKVTGTNKKDKITWVNSKAWKKALTVNAGKGDDIINFKKSKYKNTLNGQDGKDIIYGGKNNDTITGGKGSDTIYTGKGTNTVIINKGDGNDTIYHQGTKTNLQVKGAKASDIQKYTKSGNDLILTYTHAGTKVSEVITLKNYYTGNKNIYLNNQKIENLVNSKGLTINGSSGNDTITGSNGNDAIFGNGGNDVINAGNGNDQIYGGAGNDTINAGAGTNTINFAKNNGTNTIINGGGTDTLVFTDETDFSNFAIAYSGNDLNISASGTTAKLQNFKSGNHSAKYLKIGDETYDISNAIISDSSLINGTDNNDLIFATGNESGQHVIAGDGNDTIYGGAGNDIINAGAGINTINFAKNKINRIMGKEDVPDVIYDFLKNLLKKIDRAVQFVNDNKINEIENWDEIIEFLHIIDQDYELALSQLKDNYIEH